MIRSFRTISAVLLLCLAIGSCSKDADISSGYASEGPVGSTVQCIDVEFDEETADMFESDPAFLREYLDANSIVYVSRIFPDAGVWEARHREAGLHRWYRLGLMGKDVTKAAVSAEHLPGVVQSSPRPRIRRAGIPFNDDFSSLQWGLFNDGTMRGAGRTYGNAFKAGIDINVIPVWERFTAGSPEVIVAVIDGGVYEHPDLKGVLIPPGSDGSRNFIENDTSDPYTIIPEHHGTSVASVIGSINNNSMWLCGVAGGKDGTGGVRILNCQVISSDPDDPEKTVSCPNIEDAIVWAADHGAVICNNSWSFDFDEIPQTTPAEVAAAIDYFVKYAGTDAKGNQTGPMKGGLVLFAAGNEDAGESQPAMYENVIAVGAVSPSGKRASYSNHGDWVDICAPGGDLNSFSEYGNDAKYAMVPAISTDSEKLFLVEGTSIACPYVSGVAALLVSYYGGEGFTPDILRDMLLRGANHSITAGHDKPVGPMLDAFGAFNAIPISPLPPDDLSVSSIGNSVTFTWKVTGEGTSPCYAYRSFVSKSPSLENAVTKDFVTMGYAVGDVVSFTVHGLDFNTDYYCAMCGISPDKKTFSELSEIFKFSVGANHPPQRIKEFPDIIIEKDSTIILNGSDYFTDADAEILDIRLWTDNSNSLDVSENEGHIVLSARQAGLALVCVTVSDSEGETLDFSFRVLVREGRGHPYAFFPVPVIDILNIRPENAGIEEYQVSVRNHLGKLLHKCSVKASAFEPARFDMSGYGPGVYEISVERDGVTYKESIVKR